MIKAVTVKTAHNNLMIFRQLHHSRGSCLPDRQGNQCLREAGALSFTGEQHSANDFSNPNLERYLPLLRPNEQLVVRSDAAPLLKAPPGQGRVAFYREQ